MQYYDTGWISIVFTIMLVGFVLYNIKRAKKTSGSLYIRRIPGLNAIDEAIGRATEMGRPVLMVPGLGPLNAVSIQALNIFAHVTGTAARFGTPIRLCCGNAPVYTVAQEIISDVYTREGYPDRFHSDSVQFLSDRQFAFATAVSGMIHREKVAAAFLLGEFFAESLIFAETANSVGAIQVAGSVQNTQTPFFIAACDYVLISDEFYAASAYLSREPVLVGSLVGQDWIKVAMMASVVLGSAMNSFELSAVKQKEEKVVEMVPLKVEPGMSAGTERKETVTQLAEPRTKRDDELTTYRIFTPEAPPKPTRQERPPKEEEAAPAEGGSV